MTRPKDIIKLYLALAFIAGVFYLGLQGLKNKEIQTKKIENARK
jgi:hypothetical protein